MKRNIWLAGLGLCSALLTGCSVEPAKPDFSHLPVVTFGQAIPTNKEYILHFPANAPITTNVSIEGNLLQQPAKDVLSVKLNKDIYAYKNWVSYDRQHWEIARKVFDIHTLVRLPSTQHPEPGNIRVTVNQKSPTTK